MEDYYQSYLIRDWQRLDRAAAAAVIQQVLQEYGLPWEPAAADRDVLDVENSYLASGGEFWVVEEQGNIVGTAAYYPIERGQNAVEIRKMYLLPSARGKGLGQVLLQALEQAIAARGFEQIWLETASILREAVQLYENCGYRPASGVETRRCDRVYVKDIGRLTKNQ
ncbi:MAG: GNAT family N-acetyltransferase [Cyanophyceae cyanobacterium]